MGPDGQLSETRRRKDVGDQAIEEEEGAGGRREKSCTVPYIV
jgi:hypothetical protein